MQYQNPKVSYGSISGTLQISGCLRTILANTMGNELQKKDWIAKNKCFVHIVTINRCSNQKKKNLQRLPDDDEEETETLRLQMMKLKPNFSSHHHYKLTTIVHNTIFHAYNFVQLA